MTHRQAACIGGVLGIATALLSVTLVFAIGQLLWAVVGEPL